MIKNSEVVSSLLLLLRDAVASEQGYRRTLSHLQDANEKTLFIHFWQEHFRIGCELEDKIRWLRGSVGTENRSRPWATLAFERSTAEERRDALQRCQLLDDAYLRHCDAILQTPLPADVRSMLKMHSLKVAGIKRRIAESLPITQSVRPMERATTPSVPSTNLIPKLIPTA